MPRSSSIDDLMALAVTANSDVHACVSILAPTADTPFARRTLVRTVFAYVEAWASIQRRLLLEQHDIGVIALTRAEHALLHCESYELDTAGRPHARPNRLPDGHRLVRFLLATGARAFGTDEPPDFSARGWSSFCSAWKIRNRITHPAHASDLELTDDDIAAVHAGYLWFCGVSKRLSDQCSDRLMAHRRGGA